MILTALIVGCVIGILGAFWDDILAFLKKAIEKVKQLIRGVVQGAKISCAKSGKGFRKSQETIPMKMAAGRKRPSQGPSPKVKCLPISAPELAIARTWILQTRCS